MYIDDFVTSRIRAEMQELTLRQAIDLCEIPDFKNEQGISRALAAIVVETNLPLSAWTIQERIAGICHYLTAQEQDDWEVVDGAKLSDYLIEADSPPTEPYRFDDLEIRPITGEYAEAMERVLSLRGKRGDWIVAAMAASIFEQGQERDNSGTPDDFVRENMERLYRLPESDFNELLAHFQNAQIYLAHCFQVFFADDGVAVEARKGGADLPSVRFQFNQIISETTQALWGKPDEPSTDHLHDEQAGLEQRDGMADFRSAEFD